MVPLAEQDRSLWDTAMIAEGVERQSQVDYLGQRGVHLIQGYVYAKPMALTKLKIWLLAWRQSQPGGQ